MTTRPPLVEALASLRDARSNHDVVITTMGASREWMALGPLHPLDFVYVPSSMSQGTSLGLGLALARPDLRVIVCNGDGSMLMNLGSLVTITAEAPPNLVVIVFDNGVYEVTGAQATPGSAGARADSANVDFGDIARACGFRRVLRFDHVEKWQSSIASTLEGEGPTFVHILVPPIPGALGPRSPGPARERGARFMQALRETGG